MRSFELGSFFFGLFVAVTSGAEAQTGAATQPNYVQQPQAGYQQPQAGYQQPQAGYQQPQAGYQQPQAGYQQPQAGYQQPQAGYQQPQAGYQQPQAGYQQPQAGYQQPYQTSSTTKKRGDTEMGALYVTSAAYGIGMGDLGIDRDGAR